MRKQPHPTDVHVGQQIRARRMIVGMSQEKLGEHVGLTFQQIQKYEKGANRVGASRLHEFARILSVPVGYFFDGLDEPSLSSDFTTLSQESMRLAIEYEALPSGHRSSVRKIIKVLADVTQESAEAA